MDETLQAKTFLIYIPPSEEVSNLIEQASLLLRENHPSNTYIPLYKGKWHSHLMVYLSPMPVTEEQNIVKAVEQVAQETSKFTVKLADMEMAEGNYLQVRIAQESQSSIRAIREKLVDALVPFRDKTIKSKYLQKWDSFTEAEQLRIKTTGIPYVYEPHLTIAVFGSPEELAQAYKKVSNFNFKDKAFDAEKIEVQTMFGSDYRNKEIILAKGFTVHK